MKKINLLMLFLMLIGTGAFAQNFFTARQESSSAQAREVAKQVSKKRIFQLNEPAMRNYLRAARLEFKNNGITLPLEIPLPDGRTEIFNMVESPVMEPALTAKYPEIKTYSGNGTKDKKSVIRISLTPAGFSAIILNTAGEEVYFEKYSNTLPDVYFNYFGKDAKAPAGGVSRSGSCGMTLPVERPIGANSQRGNLSAARITSGATLTTYRLALAATGEFTGRHGGTVASSLATIVGYVNRMTATYRNELSVSFTLVANNDLLIYTDTATDPYTGYKENTMLNENQTNVDAIVGDANYDIAHVFSWNIDYGSGGGVALRPSLGQSGSKASGASIEGEYYAQIFYDQLLFHEIGHMFGMTHSYNSTLPVCTSRSDETPVEPGAGATIMSYGFTCRTDNYFESDVIGPILTFHTLNYDQAKDHMATIPSVGTITTTGNTSPVVTVPSNYTIPKSTPFALTGSATDANGDALTYSWEGTNIGTVVPDATTLANTAQPPFFRTYEPSTSPTRIFPLLSAILDGSNYAKGDKLPSVGIATTHRLTVRDNNAAGGGVEYSSVTVTVNGSIGPFLVTSNLSGSYAANSNRNVTWSVNGTSTATPNVKISLSTDGGLTFPIVLAASTPNDGTQSVTIPNNATTTGRIKVESVGNIFFDISNADFTITAAPGVQYSIIANAGNNGTITPTGNVRVNSGANQTFTIAANAGYAIEDVIVDNVSQGPVPTYTFTNVTSDHAIRAKFTTSTLKITATAGPNGTITPSGVINLASGANQTFTFAANPGYNIEDVKVDSVSLGALADYTFTNVTTDHKIKVTFKCAPITVTAAITDLKCNGVLTGAINLTVANGIAPYTYAWTGNGGTFTSTSKNITGLDAGNYNVTVTAANGCDDRETFSVTQPDKLKTDVVYKGNLSCFGANDGYIQVYAKGGTPPYANALNGGTFQQEGQYGSVFENLAAGIYTITIRDANLCTVTDNPPTIITQPAAVSASICYNAAANKIHVVGTSGVAPFRYSTDGITYKAAATTDGGRDFPVTGSTYTMYVKNKKDCIYSTSGNISSLPDCAGAKIASRNSAEPATVLEATVSPNPSDAVFTVKVNSSNTTEPIRLRVLDLNRKVLYTSQGAVKGAYRFGENFVPGIYVIEITQGNAIKTIKAVKGK